MLFRSRFEVAGSRYLPWLQCRGKEWVRRLGAFAAMRITASWSGSSPTEYKDVARMFVLPYAGSPRTSSSRPPHVGQAIDRQTILAGRGPPSRRASPPPSAADGLDRVPLTWPRMLPFVQWRRVMAGRRRLRPKKEELAPLLQTNSRREQADRPFAAPP